MDPLTLIDLLSKGSSVVLSVLLVGFLFEWVVSGRAHKAAKAEAERREAECREDCKRKDQKIDELNAALLRAVRVTGKVAEVSAAEKKE